MIAIIPARGGSKGLPKKNVKLLGGKPLILWTVEAAMASERIDRVILSTDDQEIADVCKNSGVDIPFMRPSNLAEDDSLAIDNYIYTLERLDNEFGEKYNEFVVLHPTSPLRNSLDIDNAVALFIEKEADSVISCVELEHPLEWAFFLNNDGTIVRNSETESGKMSNRQQMDNSYIPNGGVYVFKVSQLKKHNSYYSDKTFANIMPSERSIDIDTEFDFLFAEFLMERKNNEYKNFTK